MDHMNQLSRETRACIEACLLCHGICYSTAMIHCLEMGGDHTRPQHFRLMLECAIVCRTAADLMAQKSQFHHQMCRLCAEICDACAVDCEALAGMEDCARACRACAEACRLMGH